MRRLRPARARRLGRLRRAVPRASGRRRPPRRHPGRRRRPRRHPRLPRRARARPAAAAALARHRLAPGRRLHAARHGRLAGLPRGPDRRPRRGGRALPVRARALGAQRGSSTTPSGACAGPRASSPATAPGRRPAPAPTRWRGSPPTPAIPTRAPRSPTPWPRRRCSTTTRRPPPSRSGARWSCRPRSTSPSSAPRSSCAPASSSPPPASASSALERLAGAYRIARRLGARPLAMQAAEETARLGESVERRLGRRAAAAHDGAGLTRREVEVVRLLAVGRTNREIARELVPQPAHGRRAPAQHLRQARLPLARRGDDARERARAARVASPRRSAPARRARPGRSRAAGRRGWPGRARCRR